ncbi:hypothetical protein [Microcoleus sp. FACHB-672]|uniref:hypothetical protein n=1 Tax=Microcoleus sp. FACHB-672 TaxID=2692825 RepID=UPI001684CEAE|nr:hypothetical protein [Microcoleus sp. FACHB-672]MBD2042699.1 hypothetical protein [Microcoleus sp. FACHB-672]
MDILEERKAQIQIAMPLLFYRTLLLGQRTRFRSVVISAVMFKILNKSVEKFIRIYIADAGRLLNVPAAES